MALYCFIRGLVFAADVTRALIGLLWGIFSCNTDGPVMVLQRQRAMQQTTYYNLERSDFTGKSQTSTLPLKFAGKDLTLGSVISG